MRGGGIDGLQQFLKLTFGIFVRRRGTEAIEHFSEEEGDEVPSGDHAAIKEDGAGDSFKSIGEGGIAIPAAVAFLTATHEQKGAEFDVTSHLGEGFTGDELGADLCEQSLVSVFIAVKEHLGEEKLEHGITEELEALIIRESSLAFIAKAGMSECLGKKRRVPECVTEDGFEEFHERDGERKEKALASNLGRVFRQGCQSGVIDGARTRNNQNHNLELYH